MTVALAVVSADGVVIAADSRTTLRIGPNAPTRVLSDYTHKVFQAGDAAIATYGWAFLSERNIAGHMAEFTEAEGVAELPLDQLANRLAEFFGARYEAHIAANPQDTPDPDQLALGFLVGGYLEGRGRTYEITYPGGNVNARNDSVDNPGASWRGQTDVISRLVKGVDMNALAAAAQADGKQQHVEDLRQTFAGIEYLIPFNAMSLQDAVDFAIFAIRTTIDTQRLTYGLLRSPGSWPGVGGPIELTTVTATDGFGWVQRTEIQAERRAGEAEAV